MWKCKIQKMWKCKNQKMWKCRTQKIWNIKKINSAFKNPKKLIVIILNTNYLIKHFVVFGFIMHAYIYARRRRNLAILRIMTINFFGFSNAAFIFFIFHIFCILHFYIFWILHFHIFCIFEICILHFSLLSFLLWWEWVCC